ncbi:sensor histidine kinase [Streptosporangium sp. G12]
MTSLLDVRAVRVLLWALIRVATAPVALVLIAVRALRPFVVLVLLLVMLFPGTFGDQDVEVSWLEGLVCVAVLGLMLLPLRRVLASLAAWHLRLAARLLGPGPGELALARAQEQLRIDQELHDSIGHMLSMIVVQAGAGAHVFDHDPGFARQALATIEQRGRAALGELDRIISGIQGHAPLPGGDDPAALTALIDGAREAGMAVTASIEATGLPPAIGRGVHRIVQEALTNAAKHAPGRPVTVEVGTGSGAVTIRVVNAFDGPASPGHGHGLASIRDRVSLLGGTATIGPAAGEFTVRAVLPLES